MTGEQLKKILDERAAAREQDMAEASQIREQAIDEGKWPSNQTSEKAQKSSTGSSQTKQTAQISEPAGELTGDALIQGTKARAREHAQSTKVKAYEAEKAYNDYLKSDERKQNISKMMQEDTAAMLMNGLPGIENFRPSVDEKEGYLKAQADYWKEQARQEEDLAVLEKDLEELQSWSEEDQQALKRYITGRDVDFYETLSPNSNGIRIGNAEREAAGLFKKYGKQKVDELAESYSRLLSDQETQNTAQQAQESAGSGFWAGLGHSVASVGANLAGGASGLAGYAKELGQQTGRYSTLDPNNAGMLLSNYAGAVRGEVAENIEGEDGENGVLGKVGSVLYQGAMSAADSIARVAAFGGAGSLGLAAVNSFSQTLSDASRQGATPQQAAILATANAAVETLSEKIPLDNLLATAKAGKQPIGEIVKRALAQAGIEATTEEISLVGEFLNEAAILREKSSYNQEIADLVANGMPYNEAKAKASKAVWDEAVNTFFVSAASGGMSSAGGSIFANVTSPDVAQGTAKQPESVETVQAAQEPIQTENAVPEAVAPTDIISETVEKLKINGTVSNKQAEAILMDPEALKLLAEQTGVEPSGTKSQKRDAVKQAIRQLAGEDVPAAMSEAGKQSLLEDLGQGLWENSPAAQEQESQTQEQEPRTMQETTGIPPKAQTVAAAAEPDTEASDGLLFGNAPAEFLGSGDSDAKGGEWSVGAANQNFTGTAAYDELLTDENVQPARANDTKNVEVPKVDAYGRNVTEFAQNVMNSDVISERDIDTAKRLIAEGAFGHETQSMEQVRDSVYEEIQDKGISKSVREVSMAAESGKLSEHDVAKAEVLFAMLSNKNGTIAESMAGELLVDLQQMATQSGRQLNMFKLLRRLTPEGQLSAVQTNVQRYVDKLNQSRSAKKQITVDTPTELAQDYLDAAKDEASAENAVSTGLAKVIDETVGEVKGDLADNAVKTSLDYFYSGDNTNGNTDNGPINGLQTNDMAERVGRRVADSLSRQAGASSQSVEDILYREIMRFANDKARAGRAQNAASEDANRNLSALRDHYRYRSFFQTAWDIARDRVESNLQTMRKNDPRIPVIEQFLASGDEVLGIENESPVSAMDYANPKSTIRRATKEAATAAGIRMDNRSETVRSEVRKKMRDILVENAQEKEKAASRIAEIAMDGLQLDEKSADAMANDIVRAFYNDLAEQSARRVARMFSIKENGTAQKVQETLAGKLEKLYNMGAFSYPEYRSAVMESLFGREGIDIPDSLIEKFVQSAGERRQAALDQIYMNAAAQIPATLGEKFNAWRYMAMMGNVKTNVRNIAGNLAFVPYTEAKRVMGSAFEKLLPKEQRAKSVLNPLSSEDRQLRSWAQSDAKTVDVNDALKYSAKLGDDTSMSVIRENQRVFKNGILEGARKLTEALPAKGDMLFKNREYSVSLAGFLKARGYSYADVQSGNIDTAVLDEGRNYAINEAMKATFNDCNAFSDFLANDLRYKGDNPVGKALNILGEGVMPFRRTPANIVVRMVENSPVGLVKGAWNMATQVHQGNVSAASAIDQLAAGLTGTGAMVLGYALAKGVGGVRLRGSAADEDEERQGFQAYSIEFSIGGQEYSYTIDWAAPANLPLFVGANIYTLMENAGADTGLSKFTSAIYSMGTMLEPILSLSCMSSLNDILEAGRYAGEGEAIYSVLSQAATSYFTQGIPSLVRQTAQALQKNKQRTFANSSDPLLRDLERKAAGIPFAGSAFQTDTVNEWGETESRGNAFERVFNAYFNPGTLKAIDNSALEQEVSRLNESQPDSVTPPDTAKTISYTDVDGERHSNQRLTEEEYNTLATVQGQTAKAILEQTIESDIYKAMTDEQKAKVFDYVYDYAREKGRTEALDGYPGMDSWMEGIEGSESKAILGKVMTASFTDAFSSLTESWANGGDGEGAVASLDQAYSIYEGMPPMERRVFRDNAAGRLGYYLEAKKAGVSTDTFTELYRAFYGIYKRTGINTGDKAKEWSYALEKAEEARKITSAQKDTLKGSMVYYQMFPAQTEKFDQMTEAGVSADSAKIIGSLLDGITGTGSIDAETGIATVRDIDKREAIAKSGLTEAEIDTIMHVYMSDTGNTELKYDTIRDLGFSAEEYADSYRAYLDNSKKAGKIAAIQQELGCDYNTANTLYRIYCGSYFK